MKPKTSILLIAGFLMLLLVVGWTVNGQKNSPPRQTWEYKSVVGGSEAQLNSLGAEGWELVNFAIGQYYQKHMIFKRAKNP